MEGSFVTRNWVAMLVKGLLGVAFGIILLVWPRDTVSAIITIFGIFSLLVGAVFTVAFFMEVSHKEKWGLSLALAIVFIFLGILAIARTETTFVVFMFLLIAWLLAAGSIEMAMGVAAAPEFKLGWLLVVKGIISIIVALCLMLFTAPTLKLLVFIYGITIIVMGLIDIFLSFSVRKLFKEGGEVVIVAD
jgi:uncharacterized membrane protein HdeD (DUF308 family)